MKRSFILALSLVTAAVAHAASRPNVIYILADDLGYGDVQALNPEQGKIATPHMDQLAAEGMVFTDAHSSSSVCTPTRYGVLTGRYNWRTRLQSSVLFGFDQPLIAPDRLTVAGFMKEQGYNTAIIGKWHLGLGLKNPAGKPTKGMKAQINGVDWSARITGGPVDLGFDYWYGIAASLDMPPYIYIENDHFIGECTTMKAFHRKGPAHADFEAIETLPTIGDRAAQYVQQQTADKPFFLYVPLTSPHAPIIPTEEWQGKSELGTYGDFVMNTDAVVGQIMAAVDAAGLADNTMIIVTSDNGCSKVADIPALKAQGHFPNAHFRGSKSDIWDGGHRVPFIVSWPAGVKPGTRSDEIICLTDLMATCADLTGATLPETAGEDSVSFAPALKGEPIVSTRKGVVHHSVSGQFAYREGKWKILLTKGSGGWTKEKMSDNAPAQLYDMEADPGEQNNLYRTYPEVFERLLAQLESDVKRGRSTAGPTLTNDIKNVNFKKRFK
ncbi:MULTISPECIES: arylsulfatase [unclassified Lentimonas]|uniref:sulfatase family protein n=1 Tax=unclassified Lentimonas TaxID=2630993 RepID=UPI001329182A|nr:MULTISPECIES: arylsulfatase [unclassified Lentimonas]CAA6678007.1 Choline-sulfatase (EC [Lentimonas sp. CC4]CAA6686977.1 Choline-sulfatase (EC [Lentimonas sp. CC6]CAA6691651.1 Choline-sulfatase (EC [Lentimonas sp. CC19]CAA6692256.1 Choline-sulfatase (EC [Lentimonas sp. CC10]CAA7070198.1 Choline-sulfatase (EC [Lentimonas sp. CC11]